MKFFLSIFSFKVALIALLVTFLIFQAWIFFSPKPRDYSPAELAAITDGVTQVVKLMSDKKSSNEVLSVGVVHLLNDSNDKVTNLLKAGIEDSPNFEIERGSLIMTFLEDVFQSITNATSWDEIVKVGQKVELDILMAGKVLDVQPIGEGARAQIEINLFDVKAGKWLFQKTISGNWEPSSIQRAQNALDEATAGIREIAFVWRLLLWIAIVSSMPWLTAFLTKWAIEQKSNAASFSVLGGYLILSIILGGVLFGFSINGLMQGLVLLASITIAAVYFFWACERIAESNRS